MSYCVVRCWCCTTPCTTLYDASYIPDASGPDALYDTVRRVVRSRRVGPRRLVRRPDASYNAFPTALRLGGGGAHPVTALWHRWWRPKGWVPHPPQPGCAGQPQGSRGAQRPCPGDLSGMARGLHCCSPFTLGSCIRAGGGGGGLAGGRKALEGKGDHGVVRQMLFLGHGCPKRGSLLPLVGIAATAHPRRSVAPPSEGCTRVHQAGAHAL